MKILSGTRHCLRGADRPQDTWKARHMRRSESQETYLQQFGRACGLPGAAFFLCGPSRNGSRSEEEGEDTLNHGFFFDDGYGLKTARQTTPNRCGLPQVRSTDGHFRRFSQALAPHLDMSK